MRPASTRTLALAAAIGLFATAAGAEHGVIVGRREFRTYGSLTGFGNVVFPGTGTAPRTVAPFGPHSSFAQRLGATVSGWPGYTGAPAGRYRSQQPLIVPYAYPVYVGGYYGYDQPAYQQPNITIVLPPPSGYSQPPVTINQNFAAETAKPVIHEYGEHEADTSVQTYKAPARQAAEPSPEPELYFLIALKDSSVYTAVAYWIEGDTLHYITSQGKHNQVSLELVDRQLSEKLNRGRKVEFRLPPARK